MARPLGGLFDLHIPYEDALYMTAHRPCETRSAFRVTASLLAEFKLGRLGPKKSGRRDLNPRPPDPQSGALPSCATPRSQWHLTFSRRRCLAFASESTRPRQSTSPDQQV